MHSSLLRLQNVFGYFTTVAFAVAGMIAISSLVSPQNPSASLELRNVQVVKGRPHYYSTKKEEYAHIKFDLNADLSSLFSWNTKQVFVYITAVFPPSSKSSSSSTPTPYSEAVIWDAIIPSSIMPWHENTYIHPGTTSNAKRARDRKVRSNSKSKSASKNKKGAAAEDEPKPYPPGATEGIIKLSNQKPKYQVTTPASKIAGLQNCTLHLRYNIQPWVGGLVWSVPRSEGGGVLTPFWEGVEGESSEVFKMPLLKGAVDASRSREELKTETGAEAHRLMAG